MYIEPGVEILNVRVEKGYAASGDDNEDEGMSAPTVGGF